MSYYLRTLEGISRPLGGWFLEAFLNIYRSNLGKYEDRKANTYYSLVDFREQFPRESFEEIYNYIREKYEENPNNYGQTYEGMKAFISMESRKQQAEAAAAAAARQAEARAEAMREQEEEAAAARQAESEALEIINEGEQMSDYKQHMNDFVQMAVEDRKNLIVSQNLELPETTISEFPEYSVLWEDENSITYQDDETGEVHTDPKAKSGAGWILAAAAGLLLLI